MILLNLNDIMETIQMIQEENLDIRTITMGISLLDCCDSDIHRSCEKIYDKICRRAEKLVSTGEAIEKKYGIPIINKRISVTPIAMVLAASGGNPVDMPLRWKRPPVPAASTSSAAILHWCRRASQPGMKR